MNAATYSDVKRWERNAPKDATHIVVWCDTFDHSDYPVYVNGEEELEKELAKKKDMGRIVETITLNNN